MVTKKQHYYPRSLLKHFADSTSKFYVYNCVANLEQYVHYESICYKKYTYEEKISDDRIIVDNILENKLSRFEGEISEIVEHIVSSRKPCILNQNEIETIWKYMFLQEIRTDSGRVRLVSNFINHFSESREFPIELAEIKNNLENINIFNKVMKKDKNLESFLSFFKKPKQMNFHISIGNGFLTSDNPVVSTFGPPNIPNGFQILMPISPYLCFEFQNNEMNCSDKLWVKMTNEKLRYINEATINTANYYVISNKPFNITQQMYIYNRFKNINWLYNSRHFKN